MNTEFLILRQNLNVKKAPAEHAGAREWLLHDPLTSRYFKLGEKEIEYLRYLSNLKIDCDVDTESTQFKEFVSFLSINNLLVCNNDELRKNLKYTVEKKQQSKSVKAILSQYLSLRIPLFKSDRLLSVLVEMLRPILGWQLILVILTCTFAGIYMTVNQWGRFSNTFFEMISPTGFAYFVIALTGVKILHEFGHGLVAKYYGCHVPTIGVTLLVFWPVLYTDTSSAWLLPSYRKRFTIGLAGMAMEMTVAGLALFLWHFLPPGGLRSICFLLATTTWILSLAINLNPLMRFDGYFLLTDWWKTDNLMTRSLALTKWHFRDNFWGIVLPPPEQPQTRMIVYGWCCTIYRLFLVIGISLVIYHFVYKPLGILLMLIMLYRSIVKPIYSEVVFLMGNYQNITHKKRFAFTALFLMLLILIFVLPIHKDITVPAVLNSAKTQKIYMPLDGQLTYFGEEGDLQEGQMIYQLSLPDLQYQLSQVQQEEQRLQWQLNQSSVAGEYLDPRPRIRNELLAVTKKLNQLKNVVAQNSYHASFSGVFELNDPWLHKGAWVKKGTLLGTLVNQDAARVEGYLPESEHDFFNFDVQQTTGLFYPDNGLTEPIEVILVSIGQIAVQQLSHPELASSNGGSINTNIADGNRLIPVTAHYAMRFKTNMVAPAQQIIGKVLIEGESYSLISRIWQRVVAIFRQEADL